MGNINSDLQEMIDVIADGVNTGIKQFADGFQTMDLFAFVGVFTRIPEAIKGKENAWAYLKDMTEEKENDLVNAVVEKLGNPKVAKLVRRVIRLAAEAYMLTVEALHYNDQTTPTAK